MAQNPNYIAALEDPQYQEERRHIRSTRSTDAWQAQFNALSPSHPKATIPEWVRFAKRKKQSFRCFVLGWRESDWMLNRQSGEIKQVGTLTVDHTIAAANGGLTTDANTKMIASVANSKKGSKPKTYEELREHLLNIYELYVPNFDELMAIRSLRAKGCKKLIL